MPSSRTSSERPTLPPLHTLDLPLLSRRGPFDSAGARHERYEQKSCLPLHVPHSRNRQVSTSSSNTSASRTPSPCPANSSTGYHSSASPSSSSAPPSRRFTLVPCPLEVADAIVLVPPPNAPYVPSLQHPTPPNNRQGQALLLVGKAFQQIRASPQRQVSKGARMQPYRIVHGGSRRQSEASLPPV